MIMIIIQFNCKISLMSCIHCHWRRWPLTHVMVNVKNANAVYLSWEKDLESAKHPNLEKNWWLTESVPGWLVKNATVSKDKNILSLKILLHHLNISRTWMIWAQMRIVTWKQMSLTYSHLQFQTPWKCKFTNCHSSGLEKWYFCSQRASAF